MAKRRKLFFLFHTFLLLLLFLLFCSKLLPLLKNPADIDRSLIISPQNGFYSGDMKISLSLPSSWSDRIHIHYTTDGTVPDSDSPLYTEPLFYPAGEEVRAVTIKAVLCDQNHSIIGEPYTASYFIGKDIDRWTNALVVSITSQPDGLYSQENGILYPMSDCGPAQEDWDWFKRQNCKQRGDDWIRKAHMDIFEPDGSNVISQDIGLCVDGDHGSMTHYPYSLKVLAGKEYDSAHDSFQYDFFRFYNTRGTLFPHIQNYNNLVFRNGGNEYNAGASVPDQRGTMLRWNIGSRLADEMGYLTAGARPAMIFLNNEFYGVAQLQDTYNRHNIGARAMLNKDHLEIYKDAERACTQYGGYEDLYYSYPDVGASPILTKENQEAFERLVSIDDMFSYYAFELLLNNTDFPKKNYAIWRYREDSGDNLPWSDGKFRFLINDLDCIWDFRYDDDLWTAYFQNIKEDGVVMGSLIQVEAYKSRFVNILCDLINSGLFDREHLNAAIDEAANAFNLIASYYYSPQDEAKRQQNILLLKESAFARKDEVRSFLQDTFSPRYPYTLIVKAPDTGASIRFSTTERISADGDFAGVYYGDYPLTLSASCQKGRVFSHWVINGKTVSQEKPVLDKSLIVDGRITVELVTLPAQDAAPLIISEVCAGRDDSWLELYNASERELCLSDYSLSNDIPALLLKFRLPEVTLAPGSTFIVHLDNSGVFRLKSGSNLFLTQDGTLLDSVSVPIMADYESYARFGETDSWRYYVSPSQGTIQ